MCFTFERQSLPWPFWAQALRHWQGETVSVASGNTTRKNDACQIRSAEHIRFIRHPHAAWLLDPLPCFKRLSRFCPTSRWTSAVIVTTRTVPPAGSCTGGEKKGSAFVCFCPVWLKQLGRPVKGKGGPQCQCLKWTALSGSRDISLGQPLHQLTSKKEDVVVLWVFSFVCHLHAAQMGETHIIPEAESWGRAEKHLQRCFRATLARFSLNVQLRNVLHRT